MTDLDEGLKKPTAEEFLRKAVEELGGPNAWDDGMAEFYKAATRLWDEYDTLVEKYPDKSTRAGSPLSTHLPRNSASARKWASSAKGGYQDKSQTVQRDGGSSRMESWRCTAPSKKLIRLLTFACLVL